MLLEGVFWDLFGHVDMMGSDYSNFSSRSVSDGESSWCWGVLFDRATLQKYHIRYDEKKDESLGEKHKMRWMLGRVDEESTHTLALLPLPCNDVYNHPS